MGDALPMKNRDVALLCVGVAVLLLGVGVPGARDVALYNHSPSMPVGFYLRIEGEPTHGAIVTVRAADVAPSYAAARQFDGERNRLIKRVAAAPGDLVCAENDIIRINDRTVLHRAAEDSSGRPLPRWSECRELSDEEFFLQGDADNSFDSRYFGPVRRDQIEGVWKFGF
jgi:conjugative transfer signal peptidase TraF